MKRIVIALALMLIATTSYNQTSRKPANSTTTDQKTEKKEQPQTRSTSTERKTQQPSSRKESTTQKTTGGSNQRTTQTSGTSRTKEPVNTQHSNTERTGTDNKTSRDHNSTNYSNDRNNNRNYDRTYDHTNTGRNEVYVNQHVNHTSVREYESPRVYRSSHTVVHSYSRPPESRDYRAVHYAYRPPVHINVVWNAHLHTEYCRMYPMVRYWDYPEGYAINSVSAYYADYYRGEVMTVYGQVEDVYYSAETDEYFLYYGAYYPYQDFTVIVPGYIARRYNHRPSRYFENQFLAVTGLITTFEGNPEIYVKESFQVNLY